MVKLNKRLLPIKAHYFCFMAAMGPILPQLPVWGKQIGVAPEVMGYITSILPVMYVIAKPLFGFVADYFTQLRKLIFIGLIMGMTLSYAAFYFVPQPQSNAIPNDGSGNVSLNWRTTPVCMEEMASASSSSARHLFDESKKRLCARVAVNVNNLGSVARQVVRSSKTNEILGQSIRNLTQVDIVSDYSAQNLNKMSLILQHVSYHYDAMNDSVNHLDYLKEQVTAMER